MISGHQPAVVRHSRPKARASRLIAVLLGLTAGALVAPADGAAQRRQPAPAQSDVPSVTFATVLQRARQEPPAVLAARATLARAEASKRFATGQWYPTLRADGSYGYSYDNRLVLPDAPRIDSQSLEARGNVALEWNVLDLARSDRIDAARAGVLGSSHALAGSQQQAMLAAATLFIEAEAAADLVRDAKLTLERRTKQHMAVTALVDAGTRSPVDAQRTATEVTSAKYMLERRQLDVIAAQSALAAAVGLQPGTRLRPAPAREGSGVVAATHGLSSPVEGPKRARELALSHHPELKRLSEGVTAARETHDAIVSQRLPVLGLAASATASYLDVRAGLGIDGFQYGGTAGVFLRFSGIDPTVWLQGSVTEAAVGEAMQTRAAAAQQVGAAAVATYYALQTARVERERVSQILNAAGRTRQAQEGRYEAGLASLLELLDAEALEQQARQQSIEARRNEATATLRLLAACGVLGAD